MIIQGKIGGIYGSHRKLGRQPALAYEEYYMENYPYI